MQDGHQKRDSENDSNINIEERRERKGGIKAMRQKDVASSGKNQNMSRRM